MEDYLTEEAKVLAGITPGRRDWTTDEGVFDWAKKKLGLGAAPKTGGELMKQPAFSARPSSLPPRERAKPDAEQQARLRAQAARTDIAGSTTSTSDQHTMATRQRLQAKRDADDRAKLQKNIAATHHLNSKDNAYDPGSLLSEMRRILNET